MKITKEKLKKIIDRHKMFADMGKIFLEELDRVGKEEMELEDFFQEKKRAEGE